MFTSFSVLLKLLTHDIGIEIPGRTGVVELCLDINTHSFCKIS
jgi:hypothetical protein